MYKTMFHTDPNTDGRFLSLTQCRALVDRIVAMTSGGGLTRVEINSSWVNNLRWARNAIATGGETQQSVIRVTREIRRAHGTAETNALTDDALRVCVERAESLFVYQFEYPDTYPDPIPEVHPHARPELWFDRTVIADEPLRAAMVDRMIAPTETANLMSAGYLEVAACGRAFVTSDGVFRYYPYTTAQLSLTVRTARGDASGWAGIDWNDMARIDPQALATIALDKCQRSRNPVAIEPGRYTAILEPQAVCDLVSPLVSLALSRPMAEQGMGPFADPQRSGYSRLGQRVIDPRLTLSADPMDPDCGFVPFDGEGEPYQAVEWIRQGVLTALAYPRSYGLTQLGNDAALPNSSAFHLSGGTTTLDEMIAATPRGILVARLNNVRVIDLNSMLMNGNTRDGLWLIERGKITKSIKNLRFTESPMFILNNVEALGRPQRVFHPQAPVVVPPIMVRDFSFTGLIDAV